MGKSIDKYAIFLKTVELGSITRAADLLNYTQSGISRAILALEEECAFSLLVRAKSGVTLTANGEQVLSTIQNLVNAQQNLAETVAGINGLVAGVIRIGTFNSMAVHWLPRLIANFHSQFPKIEIKLRLGNYFDIIRWIEQGEVDCGFSTAPKPEHLRFIHLYNDQLQVALPASHPLCNETTISGDQLASEPFLLLDAKHDDYMVRTLESLTCQPPIACTLSEDMPIPGMVENGMGVSILSKMLLFNQKTNIELRPLSPPQFRTVGLLTRPERYLSPATKRFIAQTRQILPRIIDNIELSSQN